MSAPTVRARSATRGGARPPSAVREIRSLLLLVMLLPASFGFVSAAHAGSQMPTVQPDAQLPTADPPLNCRYGVAALTGAAHIGTLSLVGAGWYLDFGSHAPIQTTTSEYAHVIRVLQNKTDCTYLDGFVTNPPLTDAGLGAQIASQPGALWLVGNEPDRGPNPDKCKERGQDDTYPEVYARAYHDTYQFIKTHDPTALVANAGLVEVTPGRLQYLDKAWAAYLQAYGVPMPVDVWNMHLYVLPETTPAGLPNTTANVALGTDPALGMRESDGRADLCPDPGVYCTAEADDLNVFAEQVVAMRSWMKAHGQQNKPLILSEYSILYPYDVDPASPDRCLWGDEYNQCFTPSRVKTFMERTFDYLESATDPQLGYPIDGYRLVQRWLWFSDHFDSAGSVSNLLEQNLVDLSLHGQTYRSKVAGRGSYVNLVPALAGPLTGHAASGPAAVPVTLQVYNTGTKTIASPSTVTVYSDAARKNPIGSTVVSTTLRGCGLQSATATVIWNGLTPGTHPFWALVDSAGAVNESNESDNVISGVVTVYQHATFIPLTRGH